MIDFPVSQSFQLEWQVSGENDSVLITIYRGLVAVMPLVLHYFTSEVTKINDFMTTTSIPGITPFQDCAALHTQANKSNYDSFREQLEEQAVGKTADTYSIEESKAGATVEMQDQVSPATKDETKA